MKTIKTKNLFPCLGAARLRSRVNQEAILKAIEQ
jgi:hypothetical protein